MVHIVLLNSYSAERLYFHTRKSTLNILNTVASSYIMEYCFGFSIQFFSPSSQNKSKTVTGNTGHSSHPYQVKSLASEPLLLIKLHTHVVLGK